MRTYYIYKATNRINGQSYIGCTNNYRSRKWQHERCYEKEDCVFHRAIQEFGKENFDWEVIDSAESEMEGHELEKKYIDQYHTLMPNGYNMTVGGYNNPLTKYKPVVCLEPDGTYVRTYESTEAATRDGYYNVADCCSDNHHLTQGKQFMYLDDYKQHGGKVYERHDSIFMKAIVQCDLSGNMIQEFKSVNAAAEFTGIRRSTISGALTGTYKTAGNYIWVYKENYPIKDVTSHARQKKGRKIAQVDPKTGEIIQVFDRIADAGRALGKNYKCIHHAVDKPDKTSYGYKWISQ